MEMGKFQDSVGLYAEHGDFDIPANWTVGVAIKPAEPVTLAFDVQQINYSETESIGNPLLPNLMAARLGDEGGAGFGWQDVTAYKFGIQWAVNPDVTVRAGYAYAKQPIPESEVLFNILAPGVVEQHITAGVSANMGAKTKFNFAVVRALSHSVTGPNPLEVPGKQTIELKMDQWIFDLGLSVGF
jgi:long-chain fatty acid transport protein